MACENLTSLSSFTILGNEPQPVSYECTKKELKNGDTRFLCDYNKTEKDKGDNGFWKLEKKDNKCQWYRCQNPFIIDKNGNISYDDYSDCVISNYPYYYTKTDNTCGVVNINQGNNFVQECNDSSCCTKDKVCTDFDCAGYKPSDSYMVTNTFNYKCDGGICKETSPGLGDYTNAFCDYQCSSRAGAKYTCIEETTSGEKVCKEISNLSEYKPEEIYDNAFCDTMCKVADDTGYICKDNQCILVDKKDATYDNRYDCDKKCNPKNNVAPKPEKTIKKVDYIPVILVVVGNFIAIILILIFTSKAFNK